MTGKLSPAAQVKLATLQQVADKVQHVHGLVERFATTRDPRQADQYSQPMKRAFGRLKIELMGVGLDSLSQLAGAMEIAAGRSGATQTKGRILREGVGSMRFQVEHEQRQVVSEDTAARSQAAEASRDGPTPERA
jgi:hypothetical protein